MLVLKCIFYDIPQSIIVNLGCTIVEDQSQKHLVCRSAGLETQVLVQSVHMRGLEILKGTYYPRTDCPGGGGGGGGHLVPGHDVHGGHYVLGQNVQETAFPRIKHPGDNLLRGQNVL